MTQSVLIIEPGFSLLALLPAAKALGLRVVVFSADKEDRSIPAAYRGYIDEFQVLETSDQDLLISAAKKLKSINAVVPGSEYHVPMAAFVARSLGLLHIPTESVLNLRNKYSIRETLAKTALRSVKYLKASDTKEFDQKINRLNFPVVVKPVTAAGSAFVKKCENSIEAKEQFELIKKSNWGEMGYSINGDVIIEEYIGGNEFSVEGFVNSNGPQIISITEKFKSDEPYFVEMGHIVEAQLDENLRTSIVNYINKIIPALGVNLGVFHAEIKVDNQGPVLIEIAGRLPGDRIVDLIKLAKGVDLAEIMLRSHLGEQIQVDLAPQTACAFIQYFALDEAGKYESIEGLEELKKMPGFKEFKINILPGVHIPRLTSFEERLAYCIFTAESYFEAKSKMQELKCLIRFRA